MAIMQKMQNMYGAGGGNMAGGAAPMGMHAHAHAHALVRAHAHAGETIVEEDVTVATVTGAAQN